MPGSSESALLWTGFSVLAFLSWSEEFAMLVSFTLCISDAIWLPTLHSLFCVKLEDKLLCAEVEESSLVCRHQGRDCLVQVYDPKEQDKSKDEFGHDQGKLGGALSSGGQGAMFNCDIVI